MARYSSRSRSYSPRQRSRTPPRRRKYYDDYPRDRQSYRDRRSPPPSGLLLRNLPLDTSTEDLRVPFERFGPVKDVYLPKQYHTGEPRGFGFVLFRYAEDAAEAKQQMNYTIIGGREIRIVFAEENRKTPKEMRGGGRMGGQSRGGYRRRSPSRSPRHRYRSHSRSLSPARHDSRSRETKEHHQSRSVSRFPSPPNHGDKRSRKRSPSPRDDYPPRSLSPRGNGRGPSRSPSRP